MEVKLFLLFLFLLSYPLSASAYTRPDRYFVNYGSETTTLLSDGRIFISDKNLFTSSISTTETTSVISDNKTSNPLYNTTRIIRQPTEYKFPIDSAGIHLVRLHFFNSTNLSTALFDVSATQSTPLLQNFSIRSTLTFPLIHEFLLKIQKGNFSLLFTPKTSSFAFINAIEVFLAPENFIPEQVLHITQKTSSRNYSGGIPSSHALQTSYRINVGGETVITPDKDTLWRSWILDGRFLFDPEAAIRNHTTVTPRYGGAVTNFIAPDSVYQTAKEMNIDATRLNSDVFNVTWTFPVPKNSRHFLRLHFSNIIGSSNIVFNLFINSHYGQKIIDPVAGTPFFFDFVVDSYESGLLNVSIGPRSDSEKKNAFLNGVEIMEILGETSSVDDTDTTSSKKFLFVLIGSVVGGCLLIGVGLFIVLKKRKRQPIETTSVWSPVLYRDQGESFHSKMINEKSASNLNLGLRIPLSEIQSGTNNFNKKLQIGKGGFGTVYKGTLKNGTKVAVKRSQPGSAQGLPEFQTEITVLSKIRHRHLVSLMGYCDEKFEMILVYELMEKGTLQDHLYKSSKSFPCLSWKQRLEICIGAARGLHYLHKGSTEGIIHRDVKSTNILLDENLIAKVADFGLSKETPVDQTYISCTGVKGTFGYLDPEYFKTQQLTEKSDVYSFGVVLLEVLCARPAINTHLTRDEVNLAEWGLICYRKGLIETIVDPGIRDEVSANSLRKFAECVEKCLQEDGVDRPNMSDVVWDLEYALQLQQTVVCREPHEYSVTDVASGLELRSVQRLPSVSMEFEGDDDVSIVKDDDSGFYASEVFSQLRIDGAR